VGSDVASQRDLGHKTTTIHLKSYDKIQAAANSRVDSGKKKSLVCFAPRLAGKTTAFEQTRQRFEGLFEDFHDIGPLGDDTEQLLELVNKISAGGVLVMAHPYATRWACHRKEIKALDCELLPLEVTEEEAVAILWNCAESMPSLNPVLRSSKAHLVKSILKHSRTEFNLFGTKGTTFRPALIAAHVDRLERERNAWTESDEDFVKHASDSLDDRTRRIEAYLGASALVTGETAASVLTTIAGGPVATAIAGLGATMAPVAITLASVPILMEILSRARRKESKIGELAAWGQFWSRMEPAEKEVFAERIDERRNFDPGTSYDHLARIFGDTGNLEKIGQAVDDWFSANSVEVTRRVADLLAADADFRELVKLTVHEEVDQYIEEIEQHRSLRSKERVLRQLERSCLYGLLTPVKQLDWQSLYPPQESGVLSETPVVPKYVPRTVDAKLRDAIREALTSDEPRQRLVMVSGESKVGKTRSLLEALDACCPDSNLIWVRPPDQSDEKPPLSMIADDWDTAVSGGLLPSSTLVLVVDDLQYHVSVRTNAITHAALSSLAQHSNVVVVGTCQPSFLRLDPGDRNRGVPQPDPEVVRWAKERAIWLEAELDRQERSLAIEIFAKAVEEDRVTPEALGRLAETLASVDQLMARYERASADPQNAHRVAFVEAAVDHWVLMPGFAVAADLLVDFAIRHFRDRFPTRGWRPTYTDDAIDWATEPLGHIHAILQDMGTGGSPVLRLHDGVANRLAANWRPAAWLPEFDEKLPQIAQFNVGLFLEGQGRREEAEAWYRLLSESEVTSTSARRLMASYFM
jgi:hypothetical protein